ncbi:MAG: hypothetical protein NTY07_12180 [Bacteroidia bacterium]|nr:hypothetical protein [Bacteroidia bacterium]
MLDFGNTILNLALESPEALIPYGVTAPSQLALRKTVDDFNVANPSVTESMSLKSGKLGTKKRPLRLLSLKANLV